MGTTKEDDSTSSDRRKWKKIFNDLVKMLQSQKLQLESLLHDRTLLQDRIQLQLDRWVADVRSLEDELSQMKREMALMESERVLDAAKAELMMDLKEKEASLYKHKLEDAQAQLTDFKAWIDEKDKTIQMLRETSANQQDGSSKTANGKKVDQHRYQTLVNEVEKLKSECRELSEKKNAEISALLSEKGFVWNQYRIMESDLTSQLRTKNAEVGKLNEKIVKLADNIEQLQSANEEKDGRIASLEAKLAKLEAEAKEKNEVLLIIPKVVEQRRGTRSTSITPVSKMADESQNSRLGSNGCGQTSRSTRVKKGSALIPSETNDQEKKSLKRKAGDSITKAETSLLFTSSFKIPKLKSPVIMS